MCVMKAAKNIKKKKDKLNFWLTKQAFMQVRWFLLLFKSASYVFYQATYLIAHNGPALFRNQYNSRRGIRKEELFFLIFMAITGYLFSSAYVASGVMSQKRHIFSRKIFYSMS